ncbi:MAG: hypothetical protein U0871_06590 [Gemmataceae bacterium]
MLPPAPDPFGPLDLFGPFLGPVLPLLKLVLLPIWDTFWQVYVFGQTATAVGPAIAAGVNLLLMGLVFLALLMLLVVVVVALIATGVVGVLFALVWGRQQEA